MTTGAATLTLGLPDPVSEDCERRDRIRVLFQLPLTRTTAKVLFVGPGAAELAQGWSGEVSVWPLGHITEAARDPDAPTFDAVAVPDLTAAAGRQSATLLAALSRRLVPGGVLAGSVRRSWADRHGLAAGLGRLKAALEGAKLVDAQFYFVQPSIDDPAALIPAASAAAKAHFRRQLDCARPHFSAPGYAMRRLVIACGLGAHRQSALFFWATRPC